MQQAAPVREGSPDARAAGKANGIPLGDRLPFLDKEPDTARLRHKPALSLRLEPYYATASTTDPTRSPRIFGCPSAIQLETFCSKAKPQAKQA